MDKEKLKNLQEATIKYPILDFVPREDGPEILFLKLREGGEELRVDNFDTGEAPTNETIHELDKLISTRAPARLHIIAYHIGRLMTANPNEKFQLSPCDGMYVDVRFEKSKPEPSMTEQDQRIWDTVYLNGKSCGNRCGAVKQYVNMITKIDPTIVLDIDGDEYMIPELDGRSPMQRDPNYSVAPWRRDQQK